MRINGPVHLLPILLLSLTSIAPAQTPTQTPAPPRKITTAKPHLHTRPAPQTPPASLPAPQREPTFVPDPLLITSAIAIALAAGTLGWFLADRRRHRLVTSVTTLTSQLVQRNTTISTLEHTLTLRSAELADAKRQRYAAEASLKAFQTEATQGKADRREAWLLAQAEREQTDVANATNQLRFIAEATLVPQQLLNDEERIVFFAALRAIKAANDTLGSTHYSLALQVSMGEFLATVSTTAGKDLSDRAFSSINCKRSDLLIYTRRNFLPALVIEHQGSGHDQGNARDRDAVKRAALARAGIPLLETDSINPATLVRQITEKLANKLPTLPA